MNSIKTLQIKKGVNFHYAQTDKFKTNYIGFTFHRPMDKTEVTVNSLLANLFTRDCKSFPETALLNKRLEELYGAEFYSGVRKNGDSQLIWASFEFANERYITGSEPLFEEICKLAKETVFCRTGFNPEYVAQEKENLKRLIMSVINDKRQYAQTGLIEEMCKNEPYGIMELGDINEVDKLGGELLTEHYKNVILRSPLDIFIIGQVDYDDAVSKLKELTEYVNVKYPCPESIVVPAAGDVKNITKQDRVNQGVLSMGFRTGITASDSDYYALSVYNAIFGGGPYSKLFNNVREKMSLCYYVSSRTDKFKGIMLVNAGIKIENFTVAYDGILEQAKAVADGDFSDDELRNAKLGIINAVRSTTDKQRAIEQFFIGQMICKNTDSLEEFEERISAVTRDEVIAVASKIKLDTVYFLTGANSSELQN